MLPNNNYSLLKTLINTPTCYIDLLIASTLRVVSAICFILILASSIIFSESIIALFKINPAVS